MSTNASIAITNKKGLHARAAAKFVKIANQFPDTRITVCRLVRPAGAPEEVQVLASSVLGLLMLAAEKGVVLDMMAEGPQAEAALAQLREIAERKFDEGE